jgi:hypothetical protein
MWVNRDGLTPARHFRSTSIIGHSQVGRVGPVRATNGDSLSAKDNEKIKEVWGCLDSQGLKQLIGS